MLVCDVYNYLKYQQPIIPIFLHVIFIAYYDRPAGSVCDDESHVIRSEEECTDALKELYYPTTVSYWTGQASSIPSGCSIRDGGDNVPHLETSSSGKGNGRKDLIPICKDPSAESSGKLKFYRELILELFFNLTYFKFKHYTNTPNFSF